GIFLSADQTSRWNGVPSGAIVRSNRFKRPAKYAASCAIACWNGSSTRSHPSGIRIGRGPSWNEIRRSPLPSPARSNRPTGDEISQYRITSALLGGLPPEMDGRICTPGPPGFRAILELVCGERPAVPRGAEEREVVRWKRVG